MWTNSHDLKRPEKFASVDMGSDGHLTRHNLEALAAQRGDVDEQARHWRAVLAECPGDPEAIARLRPAARADAVG